MFSGLKSVYLLPPLSRIVADPNETSNKSVYNPFFADVVLTLNFLERAFESSITALISVVLITISVSPRFITAIPSVDTSNTLLFAESFTSKSVSAYPTIAKMAISNNIFLISPPI